MKSLGHPQQSANPLGSDAPKGLLPRMIELSTGQARLAHRESTDRKETNFIAQVSPKVLTKSVPGTLTGLHGDIP